MTAEWDVTWTNFDPDDPYYSGWQTIKVYPVEGTDCVVVLQSLVYENRILLLRLDSPRGEPTIVDSASGFDFDGQAVFSTNRVNFSKNGRHMVVQYEHAIPFGFIRYMQGFSFSSSGIAVHTAFEATSFFGGSITMPLNYQGNSGADDKPAMVMNNGNFWTTDVGITERGPGHVGINHTKVYVIPGNVATGITGPGVELFTATDVNTGLPGPTDPFDWQFISLAIMNLDDSVCMIFVRLENNDPVTPATYEVQVRYNGGTSYSLEEVRGATTFLPHYSPDVMYEMHGTAMYRDPYNSWPGPGNAFRVYRPGSSSDWPTDGGFAEFWTYGPSYDDDVLVRAKVSYAGDFSFYDSTLELVNADSGTVVGPWSYHRRISSTDASRNGLIRSMAVSSLGMGRVLATLAKKFVYAGYFGEFKLGLGRIPKLRQKQRDDVERVAFTRAGNQPTSRQGSIRQGNRNTYL